MINSKRTFANKIVIKVVACLFVPLVVQWFFFWDFYQLENQSVKLAKEESRINEYTTSTQEIMLLIASSTAGYLSYMVTGSVYQRETGQAQMKQVDQAFEKLAELAHAEPEMEKQLSEFREKTQPAFDLIKSLGSVERHGSDDYATILMNMNKLQPFVRVTGDINARALKVLNANRERLDKMRLEQAKSHESRMRRILFGVLFFTFAGFVASSMLGLDLARRLGVLVGNAFLLPRGIHLQRTVSGNDELAYLDEVLHEAEGYLKESAEQRSLIMEMVAHDMRSPLMSAQIALELLTQMSPPTTDAAGRQAITLKRNLSLVINLVDDLLTIDRLEAGALEITKAPQAVTALVDNALSSVGALAVAKGVFVINATDTSSYVMADENRIIQVLTNLIANAVKFSPKDSSIKITSEEQERFVQICVQDQGPGLPAGSEKTIFDKFNQVKGEQSKRGFGLGLTICKMLVELHGGTIKATRLPERGSKFCFWLPICTATEKERWLRIDEREGRASQGNDESTEST